MAASQEIHLNAPFLAIDFETANSSSDSACSIGLVRVENQKIVSQEAFLIRPPTPDFRFTFVHGLTWNDVKNAPTFGELWPKLKPLFSGVGFLAAHNMSFDNRVLNAVVDRFGLEIEESKRLCTVKLARQHFSIFPTKLPDVCSALKIPLQHHEALSDALACANIVIEASKKNPVYSA